MGEHTIDRREFIKLAVGAGASFSALSLQSQASKQVDTSKILNYNPDMEYRRCGKTGWMVSAVCLGGHWKRVHVIIGGEPMGGWFGNIDKPEFQKNRYDVVTRCMERGINYIDACSTAEVIAYARALKGRRESMYLGCSWYEREARSPEYRTAKALLKTLDEGMKEAGLDYVDLWRITCLMDGRQGPDGKWIYPHTEAESEEIAKALDIAKRSGKVRAGGISTHDRPWAEYMMRTFRDQIDVVVLPYTAKTRAVPTGSFFDAIRECDCGFFGIKPFADATIFKGDGSPNNPHYEEDSRIARLAIRYILCNPVITAPIPGLISVEQVDNVALAVKERRELDLPKNELPPQEKAELERALERAWAKLPMEYEWLRKWELV
ncbi:MAG: hypothetical protein GDYSWBUE_000202 [Candidatus Fervidibacterota bacterium]